MKRLHPGVENQPVEGKWEEELCLDDIHDATLNQGREEGGKRYLFDEVHAKRLRIDYCQIAVLLTWPAFS